MNFSQFNDERKYSRITEEFPDKQRFPLYYVAQRKEIIINEGEMLFIPAGWWHFVFSEESNNVSGINFAINFWYEEEYNFNEEISSAYFPVLKKHNIPNIDPADILQDYDLTIYRSKSKYFPPDILNYRFPNLKIEYMTYKEFLITKNPQYYILQNQCSDLNKYAPHFERPLYKSSVWINFGHVYSLPHYDMKDNWLCQIQGKKRVILFPPEERDKLYPMNPYPIPLLRSFEEKLAGDIFIRRNRFSINLDLCNYFLKLLPNKTINHYILVDSYNRESTVLQSYFREQECSVPNFLEPKIFNVIDARNSIYECNQYNTTNPCIFLWFLTKATLMIRSLSYDVLPGQLFIFPSTFMYPWKVENGIFIIPTF